jgi:hypothetical protein
VTGEWRTLHNEELIYTHPQILLADQIKENKVGRTCGTHWRGQKVYRILVGKPEGRRPLGRRRRRWEDGIRMDLREIDWIQLTQDRGRWWSLVNTVMNLRILATRS